MLLEAVVCSTQYNPIPMKIQLNLLKLYISPISFMPDYLGPPSSIPLNGIKLNPFKLS